MRLLIDTNIYLEVLLEQTQADECRQLLAAVDEHEYFLSDFSLHSIGLKLIDRQQFSAFADFVNDMVIRAGTTVLSCPVSDMEAVVQAAQQFNVDFDDAYQYWLAEKDNLQLVSYDGDFDRTARGRKTPSDLGTPNSGVGPVTRSVRRRRSLR